MLPWLFLLEHDALDRLQEVEMQEHSQDRPVLATCIFSRFGCIWVSVKCVLTHASHDSLKKTTVHPQGILTCLKLANHGGKGVY